MYLDHRHPLMQKKCHLQPFCAEVTTYTLFYNASIIQDIKQKYIVIIYPFYDVLYEVNIHCFLLSIQITVVSALSMYSTKSSMREELSPLTSPRLGSVLF